MRLKSYFELVRKKQKPKVSFYTLKVTFINRRTQNVLSVHNAYNKLFVRIAVHRNCLFTMMKLKLFVRNAEHHKLFVHNDET
jgi:hypothetical protein